MRINYSILSKSVPCCSHHTACTRRFFFWTVPNRLLYNFFDESFDSHIQIYIQFKWHSSRFENYFKDNSQKYKKGNTFYRKEKKVLAAFPLLFYFAFLIS